MTLHSPFVISSRLLPCLVIEGADVQLSIVGGNSDGRTVYKWTIDLPDGSMHSGSNLKSGCQGGSLLDGFKSLLSFLGACAESMRYARHKRQEEPWNNPDSNASLFPQAVAEWADNVGSDAFAMLEMEISESESELIES